ncbi:MAG: hypothetical protein J6O90_03735, partial [Candidatus Methanomethylophilaceae archaeon]|nr:hypothetical protein [Candidatus Methanomethylophilaceae archaeon]
MPENPSMIESKSILERCHPNVRLLGTGDESFVFTDGTKVYKFFRIESEYYSHIGKQIKDRFKGCRHFYDVDYETIEGHTIFIYDYEPSRSFTGGMEQELIEMMSEFASCGVACKDIKPNNLRITTSGLKFIDYGHDLVPYSESDFISMCLRAFLCMKHWANPQFISFAQITSYTWKSEHTDGFINFFNRAYCRYLENRQSGLSEFRLPSNRWVDRMIKEYYSDNTIVYCMSDMSEELFVERVSAIDDIDCSSDLFLIYGSLDISDALAHLIKNALRNERSVRTIVPNPFFNGGFARYEKLLESKGLYPTILSHSDPVPCNEGLESKLILLELSSSLPEKRHHSTPSRNEDYIFIICGRDVPPGIYMRCWHSV